MKIGTHPRWRGKCSAFNGHLCNRNWYFSSKTGVMFVPPFGGDIFRPSKCGGGKLKWGSIESRIPLTLKVSQTKRNPGFGAIFRTWRHFLAYQSISSEMDMEWHGCIHYCHCIPWISMAPKPGSGKRTFWSHRKRTLILQCSVYVLKMATVKTKTKWYIIYIMIYIIIYISLYIYIYVIIYMYTYIYISLYIPFYIHIYNYIHIYKYQKLETHNTSSTTPSFQNFRSFPRGTWADPSRAGASQPHRESSRRPTEQPSRRCPEISNWFIWDSMAIKNGIFMGFNGI